MPAPIHKIILPTNSGNCLVGNPAMVGFWGGVNGSVHFRIYLGTQFTDLIYEGIVQSIKGWVYADISAILLSYLPDAGSITVKVVIVDEFNVESGSCEFTPNNLPIITAYGGAISKLLMRSLAESYTNIFDWKLKNSETNFFLTTRTNGYTISIPEDELMPLCFYAKGMKFDVTAEDAVVLSVDYTADTEESLQNIDFSALRSTLVGSINKFINSFRLVTASGWSCSVLITQAKSETPFYLKFKNSWGVWEKIAISNVAEYTPEFSEAEKEKKYDYVISDFVNKQRRKEITNIYTAKTDYITAMERLFVLDMLQSEDVYFITYGREYACNVTTDTKIFSTLTGNPVSVDLKLELQDVDKFFSPILDEMDYNILTTTQDDEITTDSANILV